MKNVFFITIIVLFENILFSQNLVYNGSFELCKRCPSDLSQLERAKGWKNPSEGTSDYFNRCSTSSIVSVPGNFNGLSDPKNGNGYVGIGLFIDKDIRYEFIQTKLVQSLKQNLYYCLSFYVKKSLLCKLNFGSFSSLVSKEKIKIKKWEFISKETIQGNIFLNKTVNGNSEEWLRICMFFKACGDEKYLTIGYNEYIEDSSPSKSKKNRKEQKIYFYIDDVSLVEIKDSSECKCSETKHEVNKEIKTVVVKSCYDTSLAKIQVLKNINFEFNKSILLESCHEELDKLVIYLNQNFNYNIELIGHTDNIGNEEENKSLSLARANSVAQYLIKSGVSASRIKCSGYGSIKPIYSNDTESHKQSNRRVEFILFVN